MAVCDSTEQLENVDGPRGNARAVVLGVVAPTVAAMVWILVQGTLLVPRIRSSGHWFISPDMWVSLPGARYTANGATFSLYEAPAVITAIKHGSPAHYIGYPYTPALPVLMSPFAWIGQHFGLTDSERYHMPHPTMFLLWAPAMALVGTLPLFAVTNRVLAPFCNSTRRVATQWCILLAIAAAAVVYCHPEDTIVCALFLASASDAAAGRWRRCGALSGIALLFKQWAAIPALVFLVCAPRGERGRFAFYAYVLPALVVAPFLLTAPRATWESLTGVQAVLGLGHAQVWARAVFGSAELASGAPFRALWALAAFPVALAVRRNPDLPSYVAGLGVVMLARLLFEPTVYAYYLAPVFVFALVCAALLRQPLALRTVCALVLQLWGGFHALPAVLWWLVLAGGIAYVCSPFLVAFRRTASHATAEPTLHAASV